MKSLFLKIFLGLWIAMLLGAGVPLLLLSLSETEHLSGRWRSSMSATLAFSAQTAAEVYEQKGQSGLDEFIQRMEGTTWVKAELFKQSGEGLTTSRLEGATDLIRRVERSRLAEFDFTNDLTLGAYRVTGPSGAPYVFVAQLARGRLGFLRADPLALFYRLMTLLLSTGIVCYFLARYLTSPVLKLRAGVHRFADGDMSVRVGPSVGKRRDEIADLARDFDYMADRIEAMVTAQRRLLGDISHELRSPLARLNLSLGLARRLAGEVAEHEHDRIELEAERINQLIGQLLTLTRMESRVEKVDCERVDLASLVNEVAMDADFEARSIHRSVRVVGSEECSTIGSATLLRSAIENVVRNALRYTPEGSEVEIGLRCDCQKTASEAIISVRDYGPGVPENLLTDLFRPFYRVADARERVSGGTGLGLAITERAVSLHQGSVKAANALGGGLLVEIRLPVEVAAHQTVKVV